MKVSEAMRKGCEMSEPLRNGYFEIQDGAMWACAIGAAAMGRVGAIADHEDVQSYFDLLGAACAEIELELGRHALGCPEAMCALPINPYSDTVPLADIVERHLNDRHGWSRERIADWLAMHGL